jgi:hypothetical protein
LEKENKNKGTFWSDTVAFIPYGILGGILPYFVERKILHLTGWQWCWLHLLYLLRYPIARACGKMRNHFRLHHRKSVANVLALYVIELPLYLLCALAVSANFNQILCGLAIQIVNNGILSNLFGLILDKTREYFAK